MMLFLSRVWVHRVWLFIQVARLHGSDSVFHCSMFFVVVQVNTIYGAYFEGIDPPARSTVAVSGML